MNEEKPEEKKNKVLAIEKRYKRFHCCKIKKWFLKKLIKILDYLNNIKAKLSSSRDVENSHFHSLSPIIDSENCKTYCQALKWALDNKKKEDIKNIAITGPFGSGKSSFLKTFQKNNLCKNIKCFSISLATFKDSKEKEKLPENELSRLIELSILQQIFYHEKDKKIPDSRFRKIKSFSLRKLILITISVVLFFASVLDIFCSDFIINKLLKLERNSLIENRVLYFSLVIVIVGIIVLVFKSIRFLYGVKVSKLNIKNGEIEIGKNLDKSILNQHLDEILYFFEVTKYNVLIVEDLDRFEQTEIFTKLREINLLINSSEKIKEDVVFIYAVKDDMFKDKDKTKFFDFIIPIIPVINSSNSSEILLGNNDKYSLNISEQLIEDVSFFVDDMRLLHNICNEFIIYMSKLSESLCVDKLFSIIVYKNLYPNDFCKLAYEEGVLYDTIRWKDEIIKNEEFKIDQEISKCKSHIKNLEIIRINDLKELRALYVLKFIESFDNFVSFSINSKTISVSEILEEENFSYLIKDKCKYNLIDIYGNQSKHSINVKFFKVESDVDNEKSYNKRKQLIEDLNANKLDELKSKIDKLRKKKSEIREKKLENLIRDYNIEIKVKKQKQLIKLLLRNGYVDEGYFDYISIFYEGSIGKHDHSFLISVRNQEFSLNNFDLKLEKIEKLISKINSSDFKHKCILNYNLIDFILNSKKYEKEKEHVFKLLSDQSEHVLRFIDGFLKKGIHIDSFFYELCKFWENIWFYIEAEFSEKKKEEFLIQILKYARIQDVERILINSSSKEFLENRVELLNKLDVERSKKIIETLSLEFINLDVNSLATEIVEFIYNGCYYDINPKMIEVITRYKDKFNQVDFDTRNYFFIKNSGCEKLINYINEKICWYLAIVYFKIESNKKEDESSYIELLNNEKLDRAYRSILISKVETKIVDISKIKQEEVYEILFEESKIIPNWNNIISNTQNKLSEFKLTFLNNIENAKELSKNKIPKVPDDDGFHSDFVEVLLKSNEINNESYSLLLKSVQDSYNSIELDFKDLSKEKVELLMLSGILGLTNSNFELMRDNFENLHIQFIEIRWNEFFDNFDEFELDEDDILSLLKSEKLLCSEKEDLIENVEESFINDSSEIIAEIGKLLLRYKELNIKEDILKLVLINEDLSVKERIDIFILKHSNITGESSYMFFESLGEPYSEIVSKDNPLLEDNRENRELLDIARNKALISWYQESKNGLRVHSKR